MKFFSSYFFFKNLFKNIFLNTVLKNISTKKFMYGIKPFFPALKWYRYGSNLDPDPQHRLQLKSHGSVWTYVMQSESDVFFPDPDGFALRRLKKLRSLLK